MFFKFLNCLFLVSVFPVLEKAFKICGDYMFAWVGPLPAIAVRDPTLISEVLMSKYCLEKGFMYFHSSNLFPDGLLNLPYKRWLKHRKIVNRGFHYRNQLKFLPIMNLHAKKLCAKLNDTHPDDLFNVIGGGLLGQASETYMGKVNVQDKNLPVEEYKE